MREQAAQELAAREMGGAPDDWAVVTEPESEVIYDWAHPEYSQVGQCWGNGSGWIQAPPEGAVVLAWRGAQSGARSL